MSTITFLACIINLESRHFPTRKIQYPMRLLLIEDEHDLARILKFNLENAGFEVDVAHDGIEGEYLGNERISK